MRTCRDGSLDTERSPAYSGRLLPQPGLLKACSSGGVLGWSLQRALLQIELQWRRRAAPGTSWRAGHIDKMPGGLAIAGSKGHSCVRELHCGSIGPPVVATVSGKADPATSSAKSPAQRADGLPACWHKPLVIRAALRKLGLQAELPDGHAPSQRALFACLSMSAMAEALLAKLYWLALVADESAASCRSVCSTARSMSTCCGGGGGGQTDHMTSVHSLRYGPQLSSVLIHRPCTSWSLHPSAACTT